MTSPLPLAQALIRCPSITPENAGALDVLEAALTALGFKTHRLVFEGDNGPRTDNLYARRGARGPHICFAGHTDVVPVGDAAAWSVPPFSAEVKDGYLYGRGAEDMKGAIACFMAAVERIMNRETGIEKRSNSLLPDSLFSIPGSISLLITGDEEGVATNGTRKVIEWMRAHNEIPDMCVVGEPTNPTFIGEMAKIGRRGSINFALTVQGKQGHVAYPHLAENPVTRIIEILSILQSHKLDTGTDFFPPSNLEVVSVDVGNKTSNVIPALATAHFNIRFNNLHTGEKLHAWVDAVCKSVTPTYTLSASTGNEAFLTLPGASSDLLTQAVIRATGHTPQLSTTGGSSDARFLKDLCPTIEFGTTGFRAHMVDERVKLEDLDLLTRCYEEMLKGFFATTA